ncbi:MAG: gamma-glutamyl-gamma-aminobutyrate hydrolase family protein [Rhodospirillaceae bacterium]|nr:MAG: gamma-glutamyl-gamma-aminobutyrate hydrolase family protein [Rhodospirillaceae bacterium]
MTTPSPLIGITADSEEPGGYSRFPWYALRQNYCSAVATAGGVPLVLPHEPSLVGRYAAMLDGLVVSGGAFDVDPRLFGEANRHVTVVTKEDRTRFELDLTRAMLDLDKPVLGICGGQQLLAVALGGTLIQHIPDSLPDALAHEQTNPRNEPSHDVAIAPDTLLAHIVGAELIPVNSAHHQSVRDVPAPALVDAVAPDGVIEGIEDPTRRFCIGVQWHPEFHISAADVRLFAAFVEACRPNNMFAERES